MVFYHPGDRIVWKRNIGINWSDAYVWLTEGNKVKANIWNANEKI